MSERQLIQSRHGPLYAYADDRYLGEAVCKYGEYSELEYQFLRDVLDDEVRFPGSRIIEIGANAGYLSVPLMNHGIVVAFEPQTSTFELLSENLRMRCVHSGWYRSPGYLLFNVAVSDAPDLNGKCPKHSYATAGNHGGITLLKDQTTASMVATEWEPMVVQTLDSYHFGERNSYERTRLIKVDVEGMELQVLKGARETITRDQPLLYVENDRPDKSEALIRYVWKLGYWAAWHCPRMYNPDNFFGVKENIYGEKASVNMICVPKGRTLPPGVGVKHGLKLVEDAKKHPVLGM